MNLNAIHKEAIKLVKEVGKFISAESQNVNTDTVEHKGFNDLVSYVDKEAEIRLVEGLGEILPESGFIAEEGTSEKKGDTYNWIIDPLDGTTNFVHGLPVFSISVALQENDEIVSGIVLEINRNECFEAVQGEVSKLNGKPISVSKHIDLSQSLIATGFPYNDFDKMDDYLSILKHLMQNTHGLRRLGSAAVDLAYVACGRYEGYFEYNLNAWDVAAGAFIVQQAGGKVSRFNGDNDFIFGREILSCSAEVYEELLIILQNQWKHNQ
ncbi:inositol monophosphatase family protein [Marivirga harenae]|uniref:inositol monophosphatase family protein n=1 Tax=Marivirga harenae TaxID=2010992 RepID=UPI0026E06B9C|nr:inositol monophosphatase family protein [Marivirga harenae]WKV13571.1 inositol monophosphatase family protein [Marivirga harenae]|tara:strand:- start:210785 stop:211585 length:801 start_codon:yes stop_codon:yes gene_type:complete